MKRIIFAGTSDFGLPVLEAIKKHYQILLVITQPDKLAGTNQSLRASPIKVWAQANNMPFEQPTKILQLAHKLTALEPDLILVASYGQIIPNEILKIPKFGSVNIHASLLPQYRGATPIQTALLNGEQVTGVTLIKMDELVDHGPILAQKKAEISESDDFSFLKHKLAKLSSELVTNFLPIFFEGKIEQRPQEHEQATFTKIYKWIDGRINWTESAAAIRNKIKALADEPGAWTTLDGKVVKIFSGLVLSENKIELPGKIYRHNNELMVKTGNFSLLILKIQPAGKSPMSGKDFLNGIKSLDNKIFI